jgi:hypothetical protein
MPIPITILNDNIRLRGARGSTFVVVFEIMNLYEIPRGLILRRHFQTTTSKTTGARGAGGAVEDRPPLMPRIFLNPMPQFDIASLYPQITFPAGIFLIFYAFPTRNALPKISQNLKLAKRVEELYNTFAAQAKGLKDINLLSHIYKPSRILSHLIYKETISLIYFPQSLRISTVSYISSTNWLLETHKKNTKIKLFKLNKIYLNILNDIWPL